MSKPKIMCIAGARPNFVKIAPILRALDKHRSAIDVQFIHTGQHYDSSLDSKFFESLSIREPDENLDVRSGTHAVQTANIMQRFEPILDQYRPDAILVVGDVNSTIACGLVAVKKQIPVIHVEAGLRSFDNDMPEEINRKLTDQISSLHFVTEESGKKHLLAEGVAPGKIHFVGNVMIDSLLHCLPKVEPVSKILGRYLENVPDRYGLVTLHRPSNVDDPKTFENILQALTETSKDLTLLFPMHPRTVTKVKEFKLDHYFKDLNLISLQPLVYLEMLSVLKSAKLVFTDSGGIQEEASILKVPCLTLRENTERPVTLEKGTNQLIGIQPQNIISAAQGILNSEKEFKANIPLWDGKASERIVEVLLPWVLTLKKVPEKETAIA